MRLHNEPLGDTVISHHVSINIRGLYIGKYPPPWGGEKISADVIWGKKYEKVERKRGENVKEKGRKGKEKGRMGKENEKR
jgi:hypothetical protein